MRAILRGLADISAADAARPVEEFMRSQMAKGETPEGEPWKLTKDGRVPLRGASASYEQSLSGNAIVMRIRGRYVYHHFSTRGRPARRQLPQGAMPQKLGQAIRAGLVETFYGKIRGRKR